MENEMETGFMGVYTVSILVIFPGLLLYLHLRRLPLYSDSSNFLNSNPDSWLHVGTPNTLNRDPDLF